MVPSFRFFSSNKYGRISASNKTDDNPKPPQKILLTKPQHGRYPGVENLPLEGTWFSTPEKAIEFAQKMDVDLILVTGSLYLCGNILQILGFDSDDDLSLLAQPS